MVKKMNMLLKTMNGFKNCSCNRDGHQMLMFIPDVVAILRQMRGLDQMMFESNFVVFTEIESVNVI